MLFLFLLFAVLAVLYWALMEYYIYHWKSTAIDVLQPSYQPKTRVSILIAARNESQHIVSCLAQIYSQNFPQDLLEVVVINDHSEDNTTELVQDFAKAHKNLVLLHLEATEGKKNAISLGMQQASGDLMVCTDADCRAMSSDWLMLLVQKYESEKPVFIAAPVVFNPAVSALERFQKLDFMGMMAITAAGIRSRKMYMCNGANMAYEKKVFEEVGGFEGNRNYASGDDVFLLQKIAKLYPQRIVFLKNAAAAVLTAPVAVFGDFVQQRLRWATKSRGYQLNRLMQAMLLAVGLFHISMIISLVSVLFWGWMGLGLWLGQWLIKSIADYRLLRSATLFFNEPKTLRIFVWASWWHWAYIVGIGLAANMKSSYEWKGRSVK